MTPEDKQRYIDGLKANEGASLKGSEATIYRKASDVQKRMHTIESELTKARDTVEQLRQVGQQLQGQRQAYLELLCEFEEERRSLKTASVDDFVGDLSSKKATA